MARFFRIVFGLVFILFILYAVLSIRPYRVSGDSMQPNLQDGQLVLIDKISIHLHPLQRGENIVFRDTTNAWEVKVKRVIWLPGETITIFDGKVHVNQLEIEERYLEEHTHTCLPGACTDLSLHTFIVPDTSYFVLGDNRGASRDSRWCSDVADCQGKKPVYIPTQEILGRVFFSW